MNAPKWIRVNASHQYKMRGAFCLGPRLSFSKKIGAQSVLYIRLDQDILENITLYYP